MTVAEQQYRAHLERQQRLGKVPHRLATPRPALTPIPTIAAIPALARPPEASSLAVWPAPATMNEALQWEALQRAFELVETGGVRALDPTRERVDGGGIPQATVSDAQIRAFGDLTCAMTALGQEGESLIQDFFGRVLCLRDIAARRGANFERERGYMGYRLRECPNTLAVEFGYAG